MLFIFDIDGTLLLSGGAGMRALETAFEQRHGVKSGMDKVHAEGKTDPLIVEEMFARWLRRAPRGKEMDELLARYIELLGPEVEGTENYRLMPGVPAILDLAAARGTLALATGNVEPGARLKLGRGKLLPHFEREGRLLGGFGSDSGDRPTLTRIAIERAREASGREVASHEVLVIGDTPRDVSAARAGGAVAVAVCTGPYGRAELTAAGADVVLDDLNGLLPWVDARGKDAPRVAKAAAT